MDRRVVKTQREIKDAFFTLLEKHNFEQITVRQITELANINRGTFYLHYEDKYDLLEQYEQAIFQQMFQIFRRATDNIEVEYLNRYKLEDLSPLVEVLGIFKEEQQNLKLILGPNGDPLFKEKIRNLFVNNIMNYLTSQNKLEQMNYPIEYVLTYISNAHLGVIVYWLNEGTKLEEKEIAKMLLDIIQKGPLIASGIVKNNS